METPRYYVLHDWINDFWFVGQDPHNQDGDKDWGVALHEATVFTEEQRNQYHTPKGENWNQLPDMRKLYGIPTH